MKKSLFLVERVSGSRLLSDQKISQILSNKALKLSQEIHKKVVITLDKTDVGVVKLNPEADIYNPESKEILLFDDGIQVKGQKGTRQAKTKLGADFESKSSRKSKTSAIITDIVMLQKANLAFKYITAPINQSGEELLSLANVVKAEVIKEYSNQTTPLDLVAITDGARSI